MHVLENHKEKLEKLTEKDEEVADIIAKARRMSHEAELLYDEKDNVVVNVNTLREKVTNLLKPVGDIFLNEEMLKTLPENVRLGMEAMGVVIGNRRGLKAELMDSDNTTGHQNCCCCVISYNFFSNRYDMSVAAEAILLKIKDIIGTKPGTEDVTRPIRRGEMEDIPTNCVGLESRNELLRKIMKALESNDVHALGVYGMGGSGKTTLAKEVANSKANGMFETAIMVEVSESPNIECIQDQIANGLGLVLRGVYGIHEKAVRLYNKLKPESEERKDNINSKKILIVLDNIWNKIDLVQMGIPVDYCKFLLTSREKSVCTAMDVLEVNIFGVDILNKDEAKDLFQFQVQKKIQTGEYKSVANRLLEKCGGLPLSIVATANSLKGKELPLWRQFAEELEKPVSCQISGTQYETFSILRTSYEVLASEEKKKFFLLACLSPVGSSISIDNLMRYGIGLDLFQHVNKLSEAIKLAHTWAEELVSSSMLLKGDSDEYVKIHDVVRESTMSFASKNGLNTDGHMYLVDAIPRWINKETFNKYIGISLLSQANYARLSGVKADLLQILLLKGNANLNSFLESNFFQGMTNLKVLEVSFMNFEKGLPESIGKLKDLKTLHLEECKLGDIKLIGKLESLLVLSLRGSSMEGLPDDIGKLSNLRLLDMSGCWCEESELSANTITRLSLLEGLYLVGSSFTESVVAESTFNDTGVINGLWINEVHKFDYLNVLEIRILEPSSLPVCAQFVKNLDIFQIHVGQYNFEPQPSLRALTVSKFDVSQVLEKGNCLKALLEKTDLLALQSATVKNIVPELDEEGFKLLSCLKLFNIRSIRRMCEGKAPTGLFFNLRNLVVLNSKKLEELLPVNPLPLNLTTLHVGWCNSLTFIFSENGGSLPSNKDDGVNNESHIIKLPSLKTLKLKNNNSLRSMVKQSSIDEGERPSFFNSKVKLPSLEKLTFQKNGSIVKLWGEESNMDSFQNLKVIEIDNCDEIETIGPPSLFHSLVQLESLTIENCKNIQQVISEESERQEIREGIITFPKLKCIRIVHCENFESFYGGSYKTNFPCLETLNFGDSERMVKFAKCGDSTTFFHEKVKLPSVERLDLYDIGSIVKLWVKESTMHSFQNLKVIYIVNCDKMETIGPPSVFLSLVHLESLEVFSCYGSNKMQQIISKESDSQEVPEEIITFPKLTFLRIHSLCNLECFYGGSYKLEFPRLETMEFSDLKRMSKFAGCGSSAAFFHEKIKFPRVEKLTLDKLSDEVTALWDFHEMAEGEGEGISLNPFPKLRNLTVGKIKLPSIVFQSLSCLDIKPIGDAEFLFSSSENEGCIGAYSQFPNLENFIARRGCPNSIEQFVEDDGSTAMFKFCEQLTDLTLFSALNMEVMSLHIFKSLRKLSIAGLTWEYLFSADGGFEQLQSLKVLIIRDCPNLEVIIQGGDKDNTIVFPQLKKLSLIDLERMSLFSSTPDSPFPFQALEYFNIHFCNELETLCSGPFVAPSLRELDVDTCDKLEWLFSGEPNEGVELPSLEKVRIHDCAAMKSFSTRPLKAAKLVKVDVSGCSKMESILLGNTNCGEDLELMLPSLENVIVKKCPNVKTFSSAVLRAPNLQLVTVDDERYPTPKFKT